MKTVNDTPEKAKPISGQSLDRMGQAKEAIISNAHNIKGKMVSKEFSKGHILELVL